MSTIYTHTDKDGDQIEVVTYPDDPAPTIIATGQDRWAEVEFTEEDAPALALAILEAAGYTGFSDEGHMEFAMRGLRAYIFEQAERKAEAEEAKKLDEEALTLFNAFRTERRLSTHAKITDITGTEEAWREVARKARELHGKSK